MDALGYGFPGCRPSPPGFGPISGAGGAASYMNLDWSFEHPPAHNPSPYWNYDHGSSFWNTGAATHAPAGLPSPCGFGLDHARPPPAGLCPLYRGDTAPMSPVTRQLHDVALYLRYGGVPFPAASYPAHANPFSLGFGLPPTPLAGYGPLFSGHAQPPLFTEPVPLPRFSPEPAGDHDIDAILRATEQRAGERPSPDYLSTTQGGRMGPRTRASLVRWMGRVAGHFSPVVPGTLHRAVAYFDRYLSARALLPGHAAGRDRQLRLLGAAAVFVAAKYEDQAAARVRGMTAAQLALRCGDSATKEDVLGAERALLAALDHSLAGPTAFTFVERYSEDDEEAQEVRSMAHRFVELSLRDYGCLRLLPSAVAAAAIFLARLTLLRPSYGQVRRWNRELKELTGYKPKDLEYAVEAMRSLMRNVERGRGGRFDVVIFPMFYVDPS